MPTPATITIQRRADFSSSHYFWVNEWSYDENVRAFGATANRFGHGHNYELIVSISGEVDPKTGMVMNLKEVKSLMESTVIAPLDFRCLNRQVPFFQDNQPTLEALSVYIYRRLQRALAETGLQLAWIEIRESRELAVLYDGSPVNGIHEAKVFWDSIDDEAGYAHDVTGTSRHATV
jgi:6-pyruvoyltetrahydropterin/6-carboxytetrahydropterin synthase